MLKTAYAAVSISNLIQPVVLKVSWCREIVEKEGGQVVEFDVDVDELEFLKIARNKVSKLLANARKVDAFICDIDTSFYTGESVTNLSNAYDEIDERIMKLEDEGDE